MIIVILVIITIIIIIIIITKQLISLHFDLRLSDVEFACVASLMHAVAAGNVDVGSVMWDVAAGNVSIALASIII